jgi:hypothetical protein
MYSELWSRRLRQGDVIGPIPIPVLGKKPQVVSSVASFAGSPEDSVEGVIVPARPRYAAVLSHDCEFNEAKREHILLARIQRLDPRLSPDQIEAVRLSNDVRARHAANATVDGVDSFLIDEITAHIQGPHVIAFTTIIPYPNTEDMRTALYRAKRAELLHEHRLLLKQKLAWFFLRTDEDVPEEEKRPKQEVLDEIATAEQAEQKEP